MSQFGEPGPGHRNALDAVAEARQKALKAVSRMRQVGPPPHHPRLAPAGDEPALATVATQAVVDYLTQLRPYRGHSATWNVSFGELQLPEDMRGSDPAGWNRGRAPTLHVCRQPTLRVENVSDFVEVANMTVQYSSKTRLTPSESGGRPGGGLSAFDNPKKGLCDTWTAPAGEYGRIRFADKRYLNAYLAGEIGLETALQFGEIIDEEADEEEADEEEADAVTLGDPNVPSTPGDTRGRDPEVKSFKLVFNASELQRFLTLGDDVAAELDVLADLEPPDHAAGPGGAV